MGRKELPDISQVIVDAIDEWARISPDLTILEILQALEAIRHELTEALIDYEMER